MSLDESLDSSSNWRGEPQDMSKPNRSEESSQARLIRKLKISPLLPLSIMILLASSISTPSVKEIPHIGQTRNEASHVREYHVVQHRTVTLEVGVDPMANVRSSNES